MHETIDITKSDIRAYVRDMKIKVKITASGIRWIKRRMWLACKLIRLAARIMNCKIIIESGDGLEI